MRITTDKGGFVEDSTSVRTVFWSSVSPLDSAGGVKKFKGLPQQTERNGRFAAQPVNHGYGSGHVGPRSRASDPEMEEQRMRIPQLAIEK